MFYVISDETGEVVRKYEKYDGIKLYAKEFVITDNPSDASKYGIGFEDNPNGY